LKQGYAWSEEVLPEGRAVHHGGDAPLFGLNAEFRRYAEREVTIGILANSRNKGASTRRAVMPAMTRILFGGEAPSPPEVRAASVASLLPLEGEYAVGDASRLVVRRGSGHLLLGAVGQDATDLLTFQRVPASLTARRQRNAMADDFARALVASNVEALRRFIADPQQISRLIDDLRKAQERYGLLQGAESLGTARLDKGVFRTTMRFNFARSPQIIRFAWNGPHAGVDTDDENLPLLGGVLAMSPIAAVIEERAWQGQGGRFALYDLLTDEAIEAEFERAGRSPAAALILHLPGGPVRAARIR
jgi:uncharacterized protein YejL (UPF0352 family)